MCVCMYICIYIYICGVVVGWGNYVTCMACSTVHPTGATLSPLAKLEIAVTKNIGRKLC